MKKKQKTPVTDTPAKSYIDVVYQGPLPSPEKIFVVSLTSAFYSAANIAECTIVKTPIETDRLLAMIARFEKDYKISKTFELPDGWPMNPNGVTFLHFAGHDALVVMYKFVESFYAILSYARTAIMGVYLNGKPTKEPSKSQIERYKKRLFEDLKAQLQLDNPANFRREADLLTIMLDSENMAYFADPVQVESEGGDAMETEAIWSKPISKERMMTALGMTSIHTFNKFANRHGIKTITRKLHEIRLDKLNPKDREKIEKI